MAQGKRTGEKSRRRGGNGAGDARQLTAGRASALAALELALGLACPALGWAYLRVVSAAGGGSTAGDTPTYELLLLGWLACAVVGSVLGVTLRDAMRRNVAWRIGRAVCVAFLALFVAMVAVVLVFFTTFAG